MTKNNQPLLPLKEESDLNVNFQKIRNSIIKKSFLSKKSIRNKMDIKGIIQKKHSSQKNSNILTPVDLCLNALNTLPRQRDHETLQYIISYLKTLTNFMNVISKEKNMKLSEKIIEQVSIHLQHQFIPKNNIVCRYGEKGDTFYIILKGKVIFLIPKPSKCYLNLEEYIIYLMQLRINNEFELINNLIVQNRIFFPIEDDNLELYLIKEYEEYQKHLRKIGRNYNKSKTKIIPNSLINNKLINININNVRNNEIKPTIRRNINIDFDDNIEGDKKNKNKKKFFSPKTYKKIEELIEIIRNPLVFNENPFLGEFSPKNYMKLTNVANTKLDPKGRKLINIFNYEEMSTYENGQTFGFIALQSKTSKRIATAIVTEDSDLGVLTKEEYIRFFEIISSKEKKNLYDLLKFYNLITTVSEYKFIKRYYHMFEYIKYKKNNAILEIDKKVNDLIVFKSGLFILNICVNIPELNELITKLKLIKGKLLGLSKYKIETQLDEKRENQDIIIRKNYISAEENKILLEKRNYTLSIISDHLIIGYPDTVDPITHLPLFNCTCLSAESDGYLISNRSISLINEESIVIHNLKDFCLLKIEYNINRLKQFKNEIISKYKKKEMLTPKKENKLMGINLSIKKNNQRNLSEDNINKNDNIQNNNNKIEEDDDNPYFERNQTVKKKRGNNNNKTLYSFKFHSNLIETLNNFNYNIKKEEIKNSKEKDKKKVIYYQTNSNLKRRNNYNIIKIKDTKNNVIQQLRDNIMEKQKIKELKKEHYYKVLEDINNKKKEKIKKKKDNSITMNINSANEIQKSFNNNNLENIKTEDGFSRNSFMQHYSPTMFFSNTQSNLNRDKIKNINSISHKGINPFQNKDDNLFLLPSIPSIKKIKKKSKLNSFMEKLPTDFGVNENNKKFSLQRNSQYISYNDLYKKNILSPSLVKDQYIIFKSPCRMLKKDYYEDDYDFQPKKNKLRLKKDNYKNIDVLDELENKNIEDKNYDYFNKAYNKQTQKNLLDNDIKEKYKELNFLFKNFEKTSNEILEKKEC